jgi:hypothetical protein
LPHLQKLYDKVKDRKDIQIVTFNVDDNLGEVAPFMKENTYSFPVAPASFLVHELMPSLAIPQIWLVDGDGVVRTEFVGFTEAGDSWETQVLEALEKLLKKTTA